MALMYINKKITKSNKLVLAQFKMTPYEQKIILLCISKIKADLKKTGDVPNTCLTFKLTSKEIINFLHIETKSIYSELSKIADRLENHKINIFGKDEFEKIRPFPYCKYKSGIFTIRFDQSMEEHLLELKDKFTMYDINNIIDLKSTYSIRIYEILKSYEWLNEAAFELDELKKIIGVKSFDEENQSWIDLYPRYPNFKQRVLLVAQKELEEKTDICFNFIELKTGRKITQIKFVISSNSENVEQLEQFQTEEQLLLEKVSESKAEVEIANQSKVILPVEEIASEIVPVEIDIDDLIDELREFIKEPLKTKDLKAILAAANNDIGLIKSKYQLAKQQKKISNLVAWLISAVKDDYSNPVEVEQCTGQVQIPYANSHINRFVNYEQDKWDFDELEKKERELIQQKLDM